MWWSISKSVGLVIAISSNNSDWVFLPVAKYGFWFDYNTIMNRGKSM